MKLKGVIQDLKIKKIKKLNNDSKNISRTFSGLLWAVWDQFIFKQFLDAAYISQELQAPSYVVCTNYRVLIAPVISTRFPLFQLLLFAGLFSV